MKARQFIDTCKVLARGGAGGRGSNSLCHEKFVPRGGPDGGDGGRGGDVVLIGDEDVDSLESLFFDAQLFAENGGPGGGRRMHGRNGDTLFVSVPLGTTVTDIESGLSVGDILAHGQTLLVARGGKGGFGNVHWVTPRHQVPHEYGPGEPGQEFSLQLDLRIVADAGLVGFPSAGKSSLLRRISKARPKVAAYPFTTLNPILGTVLYEHPESSVRVADIPGLIENAHLGVGLGDRFLRHIERSKILVYVLDMAGSDARNPWDDYEILRRELALRNEELPERPHLIVANKMDLPEARELLAEFTERTGESPIPLSAETGDGVEAFKQALFDLVKPEPHAARSRANSPVTVKIQTVGGRKKIAQPKKRREKADRGTVAPRKGYTPPRPLPGAGTSADGSDAPVSAERANSATFFRL